MEKNKWLPVESVRKDGTVRLTYKYRNGRKIRGVGTFKEMAIMPATSFTMLKYGVIPTL